MGFGSSFKKTVGKTIGGKLAGKIVGEVGAEDTLGGGFVSSATGASQKDRQRGTQQALGKPLSREQLTTANLFKNLSPEQQKDLLINNPNIVTPGGRQFFDPITNTVRIEESEFQSGQRGRQEELARSLSEQLQDVQLPGTDPTSRFEEGRSLLQPQFTEDRERLSQQLADRGLPVGSEAHTRELNRLEESQGRQLQELSFNAVQTAEAQRSARFNELASLLGQAQVGGVGFDQFQTGFSGLDLFGAEQGQLNRAFEGEQLRQQRSLDKRNALIGALGGAGSAGIATFFSDKRLKENIAKVGESESGLNIYKFSYISDKSKIPTHIGVMAQEVLKVNSNAVSEQDGYYMVNYNKIDVIPYIINSKELENGDK